MKEIQPLGELTERADLELLKQLIHWLANKDPIVRRECLDFLKQKITLPTQSIIKVDTEEIWTLWAWFKKEQNQVTQGDQEPAYF